MTQYLIKFIFYTSGVIGFLLIAFVIAKNSLSGGNVFRKKNSNLELEETLALSPRKSLHIVKAFEERFLLVSDANTTTLLAKLNSPESKFLQEEDDDTKEDEEDFFEEQQEILQDTEEAVQSENVENKDAHIIKAMLNKVNSVQTKMTSDNELLELSAIDKLYSKNKKPEEKSSFQNYLEKRGKKITYAQTSLRKPTYKNTTGKYKI